MGQVKNVVDDVDGGTMDSKKRKLGVGTYVEIKMTAQIREGFLRVQEGARYVLYRHLA
jgi:hypothetical protein